MSRGFAGLAANGKSRAAGAAQKTRFFAVDEGGLFAVVVGGE